MITSEQTSATLVQVRQVSKTFSHSGGSQNHVVLDRVSIDIKEGEFLAIIGSTGCGKSTLLNIIAGLESPDSGSVSVKGERKVSTDPGRLVIFQEGALFPWLTVFENVELGLKLAGIPKDRRVQVAGRFIRMVQLSSFADSYTYQLSGGMKQRVAIARALAMNPDILLMDEPFAALDVQTRDALHGQLLQIHKETKKTVLFVTHDINEALALGTRVIVLSRSAGGIRREFEITLPRPRDVDGPEISSIRQQILKELKEDLQFVRKEDADRETKAE